jgi:hypothetical protein
VQLRYPQTKRTQHIGYYTAEEDAARAYDWAAVQAHGPGAKRNFPDETISEAPVTVGEQKKQRSSSRYIGVSWNKANSLWGVKLRTQYIGSYASEEGAARAYDFAAVQAHGPGIKRNFPDEAISEPPVSKGQRSSSRYIGVSWNKANSVWGVKLRTQHIGSYASEEDAARAYDCAAVQAHGPGVKRNFPGETISELPVTVGNFKWEGALLDSFLRVVEELGQEATRKVRCSVVVSS